jgi:3-methyladenine DNA glycosylase AlkD
LSTTSKLIGELKAAGNVSDAVFLQRFFKTGPGEYVEGDRFLGIRVPQTRKIASSYQDRLSIKELDSLLANRWHEVRQAALFVMVNQFKKADEAKREEIYQLYIKNISKGINNWDLVDVTCPRIVGMYLLEKDHKPLYKLARGDLWQKRVSIVSTFWFLKYGDPTDTYTLAEILVYEQHDLLQKAVGWALREMGKSDGQLLRQFLDKYASTMPRTALRYSLEKMTNTDKQHYMGLRLKAI